MLRVENLSKSFMSENHKIYAVNDISFNVKKGEIYGLIGLSGAGKSTLIRCLNLLERPDKGSIYFMDKDLTTVSDSELRKYRKDMGMIFQHFNLFKQKNVYDNIAFPLKLQGKNKKEIDLKVMELLAYIGMEDKLKSYPRELSGGQKQRVAIARALSTSPKMLLSDEGTSALDPDTTHSILELLKKIVKEMGLSIVMITHQMEVAKDICDRIGVMDKGSLIEENTVKNLFLHPREQRTLSFIQTVKDDVVDNINPLTRPEKLYLITYDENSVKDPIISKASRLFNADINIMAGSMNALQGKYVGYLTVEILGEQDEVSKVVKYFEENGVNVEVI